MLADYFTNPVQGGKFHDFWDCIMGIPEKLSVPRPSPHSPTKEGSVDKASDIKSDH